MSELVPGGKTRSTAQGVHFGSELKALRHFKREWLSDRTVEERSTPAETLMDTHPAVGVNSTEDEYGF